MQERDRHYDATIRGDRIEWDGERPPGADTPEPLRVRVTVEEEPSLESITSVISENTGEALVEAARRIRELGIFDEIEDPIAWQREIRKDRPLPGRS